MPSVTRKPWPPSATRKGNDQANYNSHFEQLESKQLMISNPSDVYNLNETMYLYPWGHSAPRQCKASYGQHNHGTLAEIQVRGSRSPSIQSRPLFLWLRHFRSPRKSSEGQTIHLGRQAVRAELVHNAAPGILRDSHSPPCVAAGQVPQQPRPILLTYRDWFQFPGLRLVSFLMSLTYYVFLTGRN